MIKTVTMYSVVCDICGKHSLMNLMALGLGWTKELQKSKQWKANGQR
nr:MAG TPA: hypothetical protein [Caudoviricetes sp.]